jgi:hypothetical protein
MLLKFLRELRYIREENYKGYNFHTYCFREPLGNKGERWKKRVKDMGRRKRREQEVKKFSS